MNTVNYEQAGKYSLNTPLVSIITVVFNAKSDLKNTIFSVKAQTYKHIEYLVIDGGSTDDTLDVIKENKNEIDYWISEDDSGIYDAMNKGLSLCNGDVALMLNAGDLFYSNESIEKAIASVEKFDEPFFGIAEVESPYTSFFKPNGKINTQEWLKGNLPIHQAVFVPRKYMAMKYDTGFQIAGDYDYLYRLFSKSQPKYVPVKIATFKLGGISSRYKNLNQLKKHLSEHIFIVDRYQNHKLLRKIYIIFAFSFKYLIGSIFNEKFYYKLVRNAVKVKKLFK